MVDLHTTGRQVTDNSRCMRIPLHNAWQPEKQHGDPRACSCCPHPAKIICLLPGTTFYQVYKLYGAKASLYPWLTAASCPAACRQSLLVHCAQRLQLLPNITGASFLRLRTNKHQHRHNIAVKACNNEQCRWLHKVQQAEVITARAQ